VTSVADASALRFSPFESARFGLRVFRASVDAIDAPLLAAEIEHERVDVAIVRLPARALASVQGLVAHGFAPIVADTLVAYGGEPAAIAPRAADARLVLREATPDDAPKLARMACTIFADYVSHYRANPLFAADRILDGYAEWAARHAAGGDGSAACLVEWDGRLAGFSGYRIDRARSTASAVLNGILPEERGQGIYGAMLRAMLSAFADAGLARFEISTQVHNLVVQRVWAECGLALERASNTVHVNALRGS
jgi:RimJ/RimL family protein N-acetyltransferase